MYIQSILLMLLYLGLRLHRMMLINMPRENTIKHPLGFDMQLEDPLDFYAVTDHAAWLGMLPAYANPDTVPGKMGFAKDSAWFK